MIPTTSNYSAYASYVLNLPIHTEEQEKSLFLKFKETNSQEDALNFLLPFFRIPVSIIEKFYYFTHIPKQDLIQEGNIGLMMALKNFDLSFGKRFGNYAKQFVRDKIKSLVRRYSKPISMTTDKQIRTIADNSGNFDYSTYVGRNEAAKSLDVPVSLIESYLNFKGSEFLSLDDKTEDDRPVFDKIPETVQEKKIDVRELISEAYRKALNERERFILDHRWLIDSKSFEWCASELGVSLQRVAQIEKQAFGKIRKWLSK